MLFRLQRQNTAVWQANMVQFMKNLHIDNKILTIINNVIHAMQRFFEYNVNTEANFYSLIR